MKTILITNDPSLAVDAEAAGVTRIMVDLESIGKKERQASRITFISTHKKEDVAKIRAVLKKSELMVRINPWHTDSSAEIEHAIASGADIIMLPMITHMPHFDAFMACVGRRVKIIPLVETAYSMAHLREIAAHDSVSELYIGLNDLHLSLGLDFLFEPLAYGLLDWMATQIKDRGKTFGFGGIAAIGGAGELPPERILGEHVRLGSGCVILSSRFCKDLNISETKGRKRRLTDAIHDLQECHQSLSKRTVAQQEADARQTAALIQTLAVAARNRNHHP